MKRQSFFYKNGLSIILLSFMMLFWSAQFLTGWHEHNEYLAEHSQEKLDFIGYAGSGHFISATFENWESEFLQMTLYVLLTVSLRQKGSSESKKLKGEEGSENEEVDREPRPHPDAPWPVRKGGVWLALYKNSLSIAFALLFIITFCLHFAGSFKDHNEEQVLKHMQTSSISEYMLNSNFWFESFQNWQSEFLAVASIVLLSIWLRQKGSPESKPVDAPYSETGK